MRSRPRAVASPRADVDVEDDLRVTEPRGDLPAPVGREFQGRWDEAGAESLVEPPRVRLHRGDVGAEGPGPAADAVAVDRELPVGEPEPGVLQSRPAVGRGGERPWTREHGPQITVADETIGAEGLQRRGELLSRRRTRVRARARRTCTRCRRRADDDRARARGGDERLCEVQVTDRAASRDASSVKPSYSASLTAAQRSRYMGCPPVYG